MPLYDYHCPQCDFVEERFVRCKVEDYMPGVCPNGCKLPIEIFPEQPQPLLHKFNAVLGKPIFRGYGWHNSDYGPYSAK